MNYSRTQRELPDEAHLERFAASFASHLKPPVVVYLEGPLGAGKTTFVRALARSLGYEGRVKSPTYGLLERYNFKGLELLHLDLYRVNDELELEFLALRDLFRNSTVLLVEWPTRGGQEIPSADIRLVFSDSILERELTAVANTEIGETLVRTLSE
ncbi:MAG TPA: tRNA (adenosine(37)-N6)-threonylcarbamoyltransferase complex ATPase subunit type 1 TsaE [Xanthomonadales bacterium]|nr:tRNA (adenosine(37)-N6)-threonylcarbamoyltransferase complex ATPase subunit type 1 TsaE [Xanthomonadales bacterium]